MICFSLHCPNKHEFESWFANSGAFQSLRDGGRIACPVCGATEVEKSLMAPSVAHSDKPLQSTVDPRQAALSQLREEIETNTEDVGKNFASEAMAIHEGEAPKRPIRGLANIREAVDLLQTGVQVLPLPFRPKSELN